MTVPEWLKSGWREAAILALLAAFLLEFGINLFSSHTVWHRLTLLERSVQQLQHERELEEIRTDSQLNELRQKAEQNSAQVEKVEEKVEKIPPKKHAQ